MELFLNLCNTIIVGTFWVNLINIHSPVARFGLYVALPLYYSYSQLTGLYQDILFGIGYFYLGRLALTKYLYPQDPNYPRAKIIEFVFYFLCNAVIIYYYAIHSDAAIRPWYLFVAILLGLLAGHTDLKQRPPASSNPPPTSPHLE